MLVIFCENMSSFASPQVRVFPSSDSLSADIAEYIASISGVAVKERGKFTVAISGGSLPALVASMFLCLRFSGVLLISS